MMSFLLVIFVFLLSLQIYIGWKILQSDRLHVKISRKNE